jgi:hypothetical protein
MKRTLALSVIGLLGLFTVVSIALAAPSSTSTQGLSVSPPLIDLTDLYAPGSNVTLRTIKVTNTSKRSVNVHVQAQDFIAGGEHGEPRIVTPSDKDYEPKLAIKNFIVLPITDFSLAPEESREYSASLQIPKSAEPGGHYGVIQFLITNPGQGQVSVHNSVGTLVLLRVAGKIEEAGQQISLHAYVAHNKNGQPVRKGVFLVDPMERRPIIFESLFKNTGNIHFKPDGAITLQHFFGSSTKLSLPNNTVLPSSIRSYEVEWGRAPFIGIVKATSNFEFGSPPERTGAKTIYLVFFPWRLALIILVITTLLATLFTYLIIKLVLRKKLR